MRLLHDQLIDEAGAAIKLVRRNVRLARELALGLDEDVERHDYALARAGMTEAELKAIADSNVEDVTVQKP